MPEIPPALATYLNDHLAGSAAGSKLADRIAKASRGTADENETRAIAEDIRQDREALVEIMRQLGIARQAVKQVASALAERASRIKLSTLGSGSPALARVMQLETLSLGVTGKHRLWLALKSVGIDRMVTLDVDDLLVRAEEQLSRLERLREAATRDAFAGNVLLERS